VSLEGFMHTEKEAEEAEQRVKKIPYKKKHRRKKTQRACMENTGYFPLARMLLLKTT